MTICNFLRCRLELTVDIEQFNRMKRHPELYEYADRNLTQKTQWRRFLPFLHEAILFPSGAGLLVMDQALIFETEPASGLIKNVALSPGSSDSRHATVLYVQYVLCPSPLSCLFGYLLLAVCCATSTFSSWLCATSLPPTYLAAVVPPPSPTVPGYLLPTPRIWRCAISLHVSGYVPPPPFLLSTWLFVTPAPYMALCYFP